MANRYWVGGSGTWDSSSTTHWAATSGGASGASVPTSTDDVFINASSGSGTISINGAANCHNFDSTGTSITRLTYVTGGDSLNIYGSAVLMEVTGAGAVSMMFRSTSSGETITFPADGKQLRTIQFSGVGGEWSFQNDMPGGLSASNYSTIYINNGTVNTGGFDLNTNIFTLSGGTLNLGSSTVTNYSGWAVTGGTLNAGTSTIVHNTTQNFSGGGKTYNDIQLLLNCTILGNNTFNTFTITSGKTISFGLGSTQTVSDFVASGTGSGNTTIKSNINGSRFNLSKSSGSISLTYVSIQDSNATGGATWAATDVNSIDLGNNLGWTFNRASSSATTSILMSGSAAYFKSVVSSTATTSILMSGILAAQADRIETNAMRKIAHSLQIAWKKTFVSTYKIFTIGTSTIGGGDFIGSSGAIASDWNKYRYTDESDNVISMDWHQEFNLPLGGLVKGIGDFTLGNTSLRYLPNYMGGTSSIFTAVAQPRKPIVINAGFHYNSVDNMEPQFVGITTESPVVDKRRGTADFKFADFMDFVQNKYVDQTAIYTAVRSDQVFSTMLSNMGFATAQYDLDTGINTIPVVIIPAGSKAGDIMDQIAQAENGFIYQDELGVIHFNNRQHYDTAPFTNVQRIITTSMVLDAASPDDNHIINVVEVNSTPYTKQSSATIYTLPAPIPVVVGNNEIFINFENPVLQANSPTFAGYVNSDGSGSALSLTLTKSYVFAQAAKYTITSDAIGFITTLTVVGRQATPSTEPIYSRKVDSSSLTAYDERSVTINNDYIQSNSWAASFAQLVLNDLASPENLQTITIRAIPSLQLGDLISWQGIHWRIFGKKTTLNRDYGFIQELSLVKRNLTSYFIIGVSTIGGNAQIAP